MNAVCIYIYIYEPKAKRFMQESFHMRSMLVFYALKAWKPIQ